MKTHTLLIAAGSLLVAASPQVFAGQKATDNAKSLPELSKSIVAEALWYNRTGQLSGMERSHANLLATTAGNGTASDHTAPSIPVLLADGTINGSIGPEASSLQYHGSRTSGSIGLGYFKQQNHSSTATGKVELATLPFDDLALGTTFSLYDDRKDLAVNGVWQIPNSGFRFKVTGGYLWGYQYFDFQSGSANIRLQQLGYVFSTQYIIPKTEETNYLHSIGFSVWGARAYQMSNGGSTGTFHTETATEYILYTDNRTLSEGRQFGASADTQIALHQNLVTKGSIGYEQLRFPFADGTSELNRSVYYNVDLLLELFPELTLGAGYKSGAGENRLSLSLESGNWQLNAYQNNGRNSVTDNRGVLLSYHFALSGNTPQGSLSRRMQPSRNSDYSTLLAAASTRPAQLPQSFLAKVDVTASTQILKIIKGGLPAGATVNTNEDVFITVGTGAPTVTGVTRNGVSYAYSAIVGTTTTQVVLHGKQFPAATTTDTYLISVTDGASSTYTVKVVVD